MPKASAIDTRSSPRLGATRASRRAFLAGSAAAAAIPMAAAARSAGTVLPTSALTDVSSVLGIVPPDHPDALLLGWCARLIEAEQRLIQAPLEVLDDEEADKKFAEDRFSTVCAITAAPAKTDEGNRAKLAAAVSFYGDHPPDDSIVSEFLWDAIRGLALPPIVAPAVAVEHDADLIRLCVQHLDKRQAFDAMGGDGDDSNPHWVAYAASCDAIGAAKPQTMAGILAKARAAKAEAVRPDGKDDPDNGPAEAWAWDLVNDLLRLQEGAST